MGSLSGTVDHLRYRDGEFAVVVIATEDGQITCSGPVASVCPSMPVTLAIEDRSGGGDAVYGETKRIVAWDDPPVPWRRTAGVYAWLAAGALGLEQEADRLVRRLGSGLADTVTEARPELESALRRPGDDEDVWLIEEVEHHLPAAQAAADLGEAGLDWLVGRLTVRFGALGPLLATSDPKSLIAHGTAPADALLHAGGAIDDVDVAGAVCAWECRVAPAAALTRVALTRLLQPLFGGDSGKVLAAALDAGTLVAVDRHIVTAERMQQAAALVEALHMVSGGGRWPAGTTLRSGVTVVSCQEGSNLSFLTRDLDHLRSAGLAIKTLRADGRPVYLGVDATASDQPGTPDVVVVSDAHLYDMGRLAQVVEDAAEAAAVVVVGDEWLWAPGDGVCVVGELVRSGLVPVISLPGTGVGSAIRDPHRDLRIMALPQVRDGRPAGGAMRIWRRGPTAVSPRLQRQVMLVSRHGGYGPGTTGTVASRHGSTIQLDLGKNVMLDIPGWKLTGDVPVGWLPGVRSEALWLTQAVTPQMLYAAVGACDILWVDPRAQRLVDAPLPTPNLLVAVER